MFKLSNLEKLKKVLQEVNALPNLSKDNISNEIRSRFTADEWDEQARNNSDVNYLPSFSHCGEIYQIGCLQLAALLGSMNVIEVLLDHGVDINQKDRKGTPLSYAVASGNLDIVKHLIKKGANANTRNGERTLLHIAAFNGHLDVVKFLIKECKLDVNARAEFGRTPLLYAHDFEDVVKFLLDHGADVNARFHVSKETILHIAAANGNLDVVRYLVKKGADINAKDKYGMTPLQFARTAMGSSILRGSIIDCSGIRSYSYIRNKEGVEKFLLEQELEQEKVEKPITRKAMKISITSGIIATLIVGIGCNIASVGLPVLAIAGIALTAGILVGGITYNITYLILKPSDNKYLNNEVSTSSNEPNSKMHKATEEQHNINNPNYGLA